MLYALKKNEDFRSVYEKGKSCATRILVMYVKPNDTDRSRIGISVSKKVGNSVVRHRIKRLIRESFRTAEAQFTPGCDIVVVARPAAKGTDYHTISQAVMKLAGLHRIAVKETTTS